MEYIISEIERAIIVSALEVSPVGKDIQKLLKSKQPVKVLAGGEVIVNPDYSTVMVGEIVIADTGMTMSLFNKFQELDEHKIKIYIQVKE